MCKGMEAFSSIICSGAFDGTAKFTGCCQLILLSYGLPKAQSPSHFVLIWPDHLVGCISALEQLHTVMELKELSAGQSTLTPLP